MATRALDTRHTILIVEDETTIRNLVATALRKDGYTVLEAPDPHQAIAMAGGSLFQINLLIADISMPKMSGNDFAREMVSMIPSLKIIFASGSGYHAIQGDLDKIPHLFLEKPYTLEALRATVVKALSEA